jgi:hypothetical protein
MLSTLVLAGCLGYQEIGTEPADPPANRPPRIVSVDPEGVNVQLKVGEARSFSVVSVEDPDNDRFFGYEWTVNGSVEGYGSLYKFTGPQNSAGQYLSLVVSVWDCHGIGPQNNYEGLNECQLKPKDESSKVTYGWIVRVIP